MRESERFRALVARSGIRRALPALLIVAGGLLAGCYTYTPVRLETVTPPMRVRAHLSPEGTARVAPVVGARTQLDGRLVEATPEGFFVEVPSAVIQDGMRTETLTQKLLIPREDLLSLQRRQLDRTRTYIFAGVSAVAAAALIYDALSGESGGTVGGVPTSGGPEARLPIVSIPWR